MGIRLRNALALLAAAPVAACWLASSFDGLLVDAGARFGDGAAHVPESGLDATIVLADGGPEAGPTEAGMIDSPTDGPSTLDVLDGPGPADAGCMTDAYVTSVLADHPLAYYRLDEQAPATTATDSSGNGNVGTYSNVSLGVPGAIRSDPTDTAAGFNGATSLVTVGTQLSFIHTAPFSVEAWIRPTLVNSEYRGVVSSESTTTSPRYGYTIYLQAPDASVISGFERWGGTMSNPTVWNGTITTGAWAHVVGTFDATQNPSLVYYVDAMAVSTANHPPVDISQTDTFVIGALNGGSPSVPSTFEGSIDEVAVYDHALTPACVLAHYTLGTTP